MYEYMRIIKNIIILIYWFPIKYIAWMLPTRFTYQLLGKISVILPKVLIGKGKKLDKAFEQVNPTAEQFTREQAITRSFQVLLCNEYEMLCFPKITRNNIDDFVSYKGLHYLDKALEKGKGAMLLFAHYGANQMVMPAIGFQNYPMNQISAPATVWQEKMAGRRFGSIEKMGLEKRWQHEQSLPATHINIFGSLKKAFLCLRKNEVLGVAIDGGGGSDRVAVDFLHGQAHFSTGTVEIAKRTGCAVLPTFMERNIKTGRNELHIEEAFFIAPDSTASIENQKVVQEIASRLEQAIQRAHGSI